MNPPFNLIGISGKIGSGKTTLSTYLMEKFPSLVRMSFAENLRKVVSVLTNIPIDQTRSTKDKNRYLPEWKMTIGELLQKVGTEVVRSINPQAWVISLFSSYDRSTDYWIIDDVRFEEEVNYIKNMGGIIIRLEGDPGDILKDSCRDLNHGSETALDNYKNFDLVINTNDFIDDLDGIYDLICRLKI